MSLKQKIMASYFGIGLLFALYGWLFGANSHKGFFYNLGQSIVWPAIIFPSLRGLLTLLVLLAVGALLFLFRK